MIIFESIFILALFFEAAGTAVKIGSSQKCKSPFTILACQNLLKPFVAMACSSLKLILSW
jgi:hypothetical protein